MNVTVEPGKYVIAVSGGVDSVALLHILKNVPGVELVVAHFDHGIRGDSVDDRKFVQSLAGSYKLPFVFEEGRLGPNASEDTARQARYDFLRRVQKEHDAAAIITAHHQDDVLETAIINLLRGTGRKGLTSLSTRPGIGRPLLKVPKAELIRYANDQGLQWREDSTNQDEKYLRNYVRHNIMSRFDRQSRLQLLEIIDNQRTNNQALDTLLAKQLPKDTIDRVWFSSLDHAMAREIMATWLRLYDIRDFDSRTLERLVIAAKTGRPGDAYDVQRGASLKVHKANLALESTER